MTTDEPMNPTRALLVLHKHACQYLTLIGVGPDVPNEAFGVIEKVLTERDELREKVERYEQINWSRVDGGWMAFRKEL